MAKGKNEQAWITPAEIQDASIKLFGDKWRDGFQKFFDMSYSQLHRYMAVYNGQTVPKSVALALDMALTLKANDLDLPVLKPTPIADVKPLLFVPEKKPKVQRPSNDAPEIDLFGGGDDDEEETVELDLAEAEKTEEPAPAETKPEPEPKPARNRSASAPKTGKAPAKKPAAKPAKATTKRPATAATAKVKKPAKSK